jgi:hypothetical protein
MNNPGQKITLGIFAAIGSVFMMRPQLARYGRGRHSMCHSGSGSCSLYLAPACLHWCSC